MTLFSSPPIVAATPAEQQNQHYDNDDKRCSTHINFLPLLYSYSYSLYFLKARLTRPIFIWTFPATLSTVPSASKSELNDVGPNQPWKNEGILTLYLFILKFHARVRSLNYLMRNILIYIKKT